MFLARSGFFVGVLINVAYKVRRTYTSKPAVTLYACLGAHASWRGKEGDVSFPLALANARRSLSPPPNLLRLFPLAL